MGQREIIQELEKDAPLTKQDLAERLGKHRRSVERQLKSLKESGFIATIQRNVEREVRVNENTKGVRKVEQRHYVLAEQLEQGVSLSG